MLVLISQINFDTIYISFPCQFNRSFTLLQWILDIITTATCKHEVNNRVVVLNLQTNGKHSGVKCNKGWVNIRSHSLVHLLLKFPAGTLVTLTADEILA